MRTFAELYDIAAGRKGGEAALEALLFTPTAPEALAGIPDDRWLSAAARAIFQAGFSWTVIENKWPGFEEAFLGFDPGRLSMMDDDLLDRLLKDERIVRNGRKIRAVGDNAVFFRDLAAEHGSAARAFALWPDEDFCGLLAMLKKRGSHLGGTSAQYFLRSMGRDSYVLGGDVVAALVREGVIDKAPSSAKAMAQVQAAVSTWRAESGRPMAHISRVLACTVGD